MPNDSNNPGTDPKSLDELTLDDFLAPDFPGQAPPPSRAEATLQSRAGLEPPSQSSSTTSDKLRALPPEAVEIDISALNEALEQNDLTPRGLLKPSLKNEPEELTVRSRTGGHHLAEPVPELESRRFSFSEIKDPTSVTADIPGLPQIEPARAIPGGPTSEFTADELPSLEAALAGIEVFESKGTEKAGSEEIILEAAALTATDIDPLSSPEVLSEAAALLAKTPPGASGFSESLDDITADFPAPFSLTKDEQDGKDDGTRDRLRKLDLSQLVSDLEQWGLYGKPAETVALQLEKTRRLAKEIEALLNTLAKHPHSLPLNGGWSTRSLKQELAVLSICKEAPLDYLDWREAKFATPQMIALMAKARREYTQLKLSFQKISQLFVMNPMPTLENVKFILEVLREGEGWAQTVKPRYRQMKTMVKEIHLNPTAALEDCAEDLMLLEKFLEGHASFSNAKEYREAFGELFKGASNLAVLVLLADWYERGLRHLTDAELTLNDFNLSLVTEEKIAELAALHEAFSSSANKLELAINQIEASPFVVSTFHKTEDWSERLRLIRESIDKIEATVARVGLPPPPLSVSTQRNNKTGTDLEFTPTPVPAKSANPTSASPSKPPPKTTVPVPEPPASELTSGGSLVLPAATLKELEALAAQDPNTFESGRPTAVTDVNVPLPAGDDGEIELKEGERLALTGVMKRPTWEGWDDLQNMLNASEDPKKLGEADSLPPKNPKQ
jgi:hypothetical protein